jgi:8-oxo-dGTP pyrophosphatase MutT (NUDIX family)
MLFKGNLMPRDPIPTWFFVLVAVRRGDRFLLVHERKHGQLWYLPAGRVEPGERLVDAAIRETLEETGVPVELDGLVRIEHTPISGGVRVRVIFTAHPLDDTPPKRQPDEHTLKAAWVTLADMAGLPLRGPKMVSLFRYLADGGPVYPLSMLTYEGAPFEGYQAASPPDGLGASEEW